MEDLIRNAILKLLQQGIDNRDIRIVCSHLAKRVLDDERMRTGTWTSINDLDHVRGIPIHTTYPYNEFLIFWENACYHPEDFEANVIKIPVNNLKQLG